MFVLPPPGSLALGWPQRICLIDLSFFGARFGPIEPALPLLFLLALFVQFLLPLLESVIALGQE
jgi:hypothetical protein